MNNWLFDVALVFLTWVSTHPVNALPLVCWFLFHCLLCVPIRHCGYFHYTLAGYPAWTYIVSMINGGLVLPTLFVYGMLIRTDECPVARLECYKNGPWRQDTVSDVVLRQVCFSLVCAFLRDMLLFPHNIDSYLLLHHLLAGVVCACVLMQPMWGILGVYAIVVAEAGSTVQNMNTVCQTRLTNGLYVIVMPITNVLMVHCAYILYNSPGPWWGKNVIVLFGTMLALMRMLIMSRVIVSKRKIS